MVLIMNLIMNAIAVPDDCAVVLIVVYWVIDVSLGL